MQILTAPAVLLEGALVPDGWVAHDQRSIIDVGTGVPPTGTVRMLDEGVLAPGLVDAQCNGAIGVDLVDASDEAWGRVMRFLPHTGVTAVVPTFITAPVERLAAALRTARRRLGPPATPDDGRARALGVHLEGPFLAAERRGAHDRGCLRDPAPDVIAALLDAGGDALLYVTLAPERQGGLDGVAQLTAAGVRVAVGHSDATDEQVRAAADAGATLVTHLYNAQRPLHHRDPGVVGAALRDPRLTAGLIADLHHVAPTAIHVAFAAAPGRIMLVTDAVAALGMPTGTYELGGQPTVVAAGQPPRRCDGTIAGSGLRLDEAIGNVIQCGVDPANALTAATQVPADALGRSDLGRLAPGSPADMVWLGTDWRARETWIAGQLVVGDDPDRQES